MIKLFVFDLGNVILPFENHQIAEKLHARSAMKSSCTPSDIFEYLFDYERGAINPYEEGLCSSLDFFRGLKERLDLDLSFDDFKDIWNNIFTEDTGVSGIVKELKTQGFPLFLLSNTNELHFSYIVERFPVVRLMDEWILSHEVGAKKPEKAIFDEIFARAAVSPAEVFYVDDMWPYVERACEMGIEGHLFRGAGELRDVIESAARDGKGRAL